MASSSAVRKPAKKTPKVIKLSDQNKIPAPKNPAAPSPPSEEKQKPKGIPAVQTMKLVGSIMEKGFSAEVDYKSKANFSLPEPRVTPFPKARHRSEGPHWAPLSSEPVEMVEETKDAEDMGAECLADHACPIERKKKNNVDLSKWKEKLKMEKSSSKKIIESEKLDEPTMVSSNEGKVEESSQHYNVKDAKTSHDEPGSESSVLKLLASKKTVGELPPGIVGDRGAFVPISKEVNVGKDAKISDYIQSYDTVSHLNSLQVSARLDATKEFIKGYADSHRTDREGLKPKIDIEEIDAENFAKLQAMSANEIEEAQTELIGRLRPEIVEMLKKRGTEKVNKGPKGTIVVERDKEFGIKDGKTNMNNNQIENIALKTSDAGASFSTTTGNESNESAKTSSADVLTNQWKIWSDRVEAVRTLRFSLDGNIVELEEAVSETKSSSQNGDNSDVYQFNMHNVAERDFLRTEGDPASAGYTIKEAIALVRSVVPGQRAIALHLIGTVLDNALINLYLDGVHNVVSLDVQRGNKSVDWQAVWSYVLGPEPELVLALRMALDDSHGTVVAACAKVLQRLLSFSANESYFNLSETFWAGEKSIFIAPIFRRPSKLEDGFLGGGFWKYSAKPMNMFPFSNKSVKEDDEEEATVADDTTVAGQDIAAGLIRMGVLPRIRYILEVDQLAAAEEPFLSVIISLARHSPTAAEAVMKCPRLTDMIIQRYIIQRADIKVDPIQVKAVQLLKVLCEANRSNCAHFVASGIFQSAARHLFCHYSLGDWLSMGEVSFRSTCAIMVEELRLWKVCIEYGLCVSCFSDFYPALCFWLSPPSLDIIIGKNIVDEVLSVTRESFIVLEALARSLPNLHSDGYEEDEGTDGVDVEHWSWSQVVPMVEVAIKWLNYRENLFLLTTCKSDKHVTKSVENESHRISSLGVISAVLHLLSCIIEKIVPEKDMNCSSSDKHQRSAKWLPMFFPRVGLEIIKSRLLHFSEMDAQKKLPCDMENSSFMKYLCHLRKEADYDTSLLAVSCMHGLIQLISSVENAINIARGENPSIRCMDKETSKCDKILESGLVLSCQDELRCTLNMFMYLVTLEWEHVQCSEVKGRGGPAPGIGVGWGATNGGFWSRKVLLAQADARVTGSLLELFPILLDKDALEVMHLNLKNNMTHSFVSNTIQKINAALSIILISGPKDTLHMEKSLTILLTVPVMEFLSTFIYKFSRENTVKNISANIDMFHQSDFEIFSKVLLVHFRDHWLRRKRKTPEHAEKRMEPKNGTSSKYSQKRSSLGTICEESAELGNEKPVTLGIEWAHQRLPVPVQWLLSPLSAANVQTNGEFLDSALTKDRVFNNVKSGLFFLLGLEAMFLCSSFCLSSVSRIPLVRKIHALSMVFIHEGDVFLEPSIRYLLGTLQGLYGEALERDDGANCMSEAQRSRNETILNQKNSGKSTNITSSSLNFQMDIHESYETFMEGFIEHFGATSFGDFVYGRQVAIYLRRDVEAAIRLTTWNALANAHTLELLPPLEECCGHPKGYLSPPEDHEKLIEAYVFSWVSGTLDKSADRMAVTFSLAFHHIAAFIFLGDNEPEKLLQRKKLARSLILDSSRKPHHKARMFKLLQYDALNHFLAESNLRNGPAVSMDEIAMRFKFLLEACEGDSLLLDEVQNLQAVALAK